jgi:DNA invertase Pin-like site-specific DNA recombinase
MRKHVIYLRESTKKQERSNLGYEDQLNIISRYVDLDNISLIIKETSSGKNIKNRKGLKEAIEYARDTDAILTVAKVDRLSRSLEDSLWVLRQMDGWVYSCDIPTPIGQKVDKFQFQLFMAFAERERELISARTKGALAALKARGVKLGFGYKNGEPIPEEKRLKQIQAAQETKRKNKPRNNWDEIDDLVCTTMVKYVIYRNRYNRIRPKVGRSYTEERAVPDYEACANELNNAGHKTKNGKPFTKHRVRQIFMSKFNKYYKFAGRWSDEYRRIRFPPQNNKYEIIKDGHEIFNNNIKKDENNEEVHVGN